MRVVVVILLGTRRLWRWLLGRHGLWLRAFQRFINTLITVNRVSIISIAVLSINIVGTVTASSSRVAAPARVPRLRRHRHEVRHDPPCLVQLPLREVQHGGDDVHEVGLVGGRDGATVVGVASGGQTVSSLLAGLPIRQIQVHVGAPADAQMEGSKLPLHLFVK